MSDIDITIKSSFDSAGTDAARKGVEGLGAAAKGGAGLDKLAASAQKAALENERFAQAVAKTATASNQAATAAQKLATEEQRTATAASNAEAAQTRAAKAALSLEQAQARAANAAQRNSGYFAQMGSTIQSSLLGVVGPAAVAGAAIAALKGSVDMAQAGAQLSGTRASFESLAVSANTTSQTLINSMRAAAQGTISDAQLMQSANTGLLLTNGKIASALPNLIEIARASARATGQEVGFVFDSLVRGIARGSPMIIDNAGITLDAAGAFNTYAASIGKSADTLTKAEQQQATLNAVVAAGNDIVAKTGGSADTAAQSFSQFGTYLENAKNKFQELLADGVKPVIDAINQQLGQADKANTAHEGIVKNAQSYQDYAAAVAAANSQVEVLDTMSGALTAAPINALTEAQYIYAQGLMASGVATSEAIARAREYEGTAAAAAAGAWRSADAEDRKAQSTLAAAAAARAGQSAAFDATAATMAKAAADQNATAQTQLLEAQVKSAADAYIALNPNIDGAGVASAVAAGKISAAVGAFINMAIATANARADLAALQNQAGVTPGGGVTEGRGERDTGADRAQAAAAGKALMRQQAEEAAAAKRAQVLAAGTTAQKISLLSLEYNAAVAAHGKESAAAITAQTALLQAQQSGSTARANAAGAAAGRLEGIEQKTGDKLADIVSKTQDKLIAIDTKAAEARLAAAKRLNQAMAANAVDRRAANEADDLDLIGVKDSKEAAKLNDRERAQASAREREKAAAAEARAGIERGEAETAEKIYAAREEQIQAQQQLDESYYAKQRELADDPEAQAALKQQYDEAVRAADEAAQMRIMFAQAAAEEAAGAAAEEKARIIAEAEDQANQVIGASERSAAGVKKATASARDEAIASIRAIGDSINALPAEKRITISVNGAGSVSTAAAGKSDGAYAGGGSFLTQGPTNITVGDNPGGAELVTVTPLSGSGQTRAAAGTIALAGGGTVLADAGDGYTTPIAGSGSGGTKAGKGKGGGGSAAAAAKDQIAAQKDAIALLSDLIKLRHDMAAELENGTPFDVAFAERLSNTAAAFASFVRAALPASTKAESEAFKLAADNTKQSISILSDMVDLRKDLADWQSVNPIDLAFVQRLAATAAEVTRIVMGQLVPTTQLEVDRLGRWAELENAAVSLISDVTKLNQRMFSDYVPPSDAQLDMVVKDADRIADRMIVAAKKYDTKGLEAAKLYGDALGGFYGTAKDALLFNQAINSGDFDQNQANLDRFERTAGVAIGVAKRLGAEAATIPSTDLAALQLTTQALAAQSEALIKLAAVPFGDLPGAAANLQSQAAQLLGGAKGGGATTNVYMTVNALPGMSARDVAAEAVRLLGQQVGSRK